MDLPWLAFCSADEIQSMALIDVGLVVLPSLSTGFAQRYEHLYLSSDNCLLGESTKSRKGHMSNS